LRQRSVNVPLVFLTSHTQPANEQLAFERGALDFIDKTRGVEALAGRLRQVVQSWQALLALQLLFLEGSESMGNHDSGHDDWWGVS
jgi:DNA-binding response OmpR family regulator